MTPSANILELRKLLAERFPGARPAFAASPEPIPVGSGIFALDAVLHGGFPKGEICELVGHGPRSGTATVLHYWLRQTVVHQQHLALVDGRDSFDVDAESPEVLARLLWVRCTSASEALKATDLILRDRNFPWVALDLKMNPPSEIRKISAAIWHRFHRLTEHHGTTLVVFTSHPLVSSARIRVQVTTTPATSNSMESGVSHLRFQSLRSTAQSQQTALTQ